MKSVVNRHLHMFIFVGILSCVVVVVTGQLASAQGVSAEERAASAANLQEEAARQFNEPLEAGDVHMENEDFDDAIVSYSQAVKVGEQLDERGFGSLQKIVALAKRAKAFEAIEDYNSALKDYEDALDLEDKFVDALVGRGQVYQQVGANELALQDFQAALEEDRTNIEAIFGAAKAQIMLGGVVAGERSMERTIKVFTAEEEPDDRLPEAYRLLAQAKSSQARFDPALLDIQKSLEIDAENHETYFVLGTIFLQSERYIESVHAIQKSIELFVPEEDGLPFSQGYLTQAAVFVEIGKESVDPKTKQDAFTAAFADCEKLLALLEAGPATSTNEQLDAAALEDTLDRAAGEETAEEETEQAVSDTPGVFNPRALASPRSQAYHTRGVALRYLDEFAAAIDSFTKAVDNNPDLSESYLRRGICFHYIGEYRLAIADFEMSGLIDYADPRSRLWEGFSHAEMGEHYEAIRSFSSALENSDRYTPAFVNRGIVYMQLGEYERAIKDFNEAIRVEPTAAEHYFKRGLAQQLLGETERATMSFETAIRFDPEHEQAEQLLNRLTGTR